MEVSIKNQQRKIRIKNQQLKKELKLVLSLLNLKNAEISLVFVNDSRMHALNNLYRGVDSTTDVLSFPLYNSLKELPTDREFLLGDIVVNLHRAQRQSFKNHLSLHEELRRLCIHGLLHLIGFDHGKNAYQARKMKKKETEIHDALKKMDR